MRENRYAKLMQIGGLAEMPYEGASDVQLPDMLSACLRTEDTLVNAAMSTRPMVNCKATNELDKERERKLDQLLDHQYFLEQDGEDLTERAAVNFCRDGQFTAYTQWIKEHRKILYTRDWNAIPFGMEPRQHFKGIIEKVFSSGSWRELDEDGWDWIVTQKKEEYLVRFYTDHMIGVIMQVEGDPEVYCGPRTVLYDWEDVLAPYWALNLQPPGPSNPHGAPHVILVDYPTKDEISRGIESGLYDLIKVEDLEGIEDVGDWTDSDREMARQRGVIRGNQANHANEKPDDHRQLRRMICFDVWEGLDVVWTVLTGDKHWLLRARPLTEVSPGFPPVRPIAHTVMIPVQGSWVGMGLPELMESTHDIQVEEFNLARDAENFEIYPIIKYRQSSSLKPEELRISPGMAIPMQNPMVDLSMERLPPQSGAVAANMIAMARNWQESLTSIGDLQMGKIPTGKSSALRTSGGVQQVLAQGEARPERILRRFFKGITGIFRHMYRLDQHFLPEEKTFRVVGTSDPEEAPFVSISRNDDLKEVLFDFNANVLNSSKVALQQSLNEIMTLNGNPLFLQTGLSTPDTLYRSVADYYRSLGQMPEKYLNKPTPTADQSPIDGAHAVNMIWHDQMPSGPPAEGNYDSHLQNVSIALQMSDEMGPLIELFTPQQKQMVGLYVQQIQQLKLQAEQQAALMASAQQFQQQRQGGGGGPPGSPQGGSKPEQPMVNKNETVDDSLPSSGTPQ